jgi:hypothetical protein
MRTKLLEYEMSIDDATNNWNLNLVGCETVPTDIYPLVNQVSYDFVNGNISGTCITGQGASPGPCLQGTVNLGEHLSFSLNNSQTNTVSHLRSAEQWWFEDDVPNVMLRRADADNNLGEVTLLTTVTKPGHCNELKACMAAGSGTDMIAPLGVLLRRLDGFGIKCTHLFGRKVKA